MNSIPQKYKLLLEKIIKFNISNNLKLNTFDDYTSLMTSLSIKLSELIRNSLVEYFEAIDNEFEKSIYRKKNYYYKGKQLRTLITIFGEIQFYRNYYYSKNGEKESGFYYVDRLLELPRYVNYDPIIRSMLMHEKASSTYSKAAKVVMEKISEYSGQDIHISRQLVYYVFKNFDIDVPPQETTPIDSDILYIILDEKYVHTQGNKSDKDDKSKAQMVKHAVLYTGKEKEYNGRFKLVNKAVFSSLDETSSLILDLENYVDKTFKIDNIKNVVIAGDGASWIKHFNQFFTLVNQAPKLFVLDYFHVGQAVTRITTDKVERELLRNYVDNGRYRTFKKLCQTLIEKYPERKDKIIANRDYLLNNWTSIRNIKNKLFIGCPMESQISHNLAKVFARDPKGYKVHNLSKHIKLRDLQLNGYDIKNIYLYSSGYLPHDEYLGSPERLITSSIPALDNEHAIAYKEMIHIPNILKL